MKTTKQPTTKWVPCRTARAYGSKVYGYFEMFWCESARRYVSVPGASRFKDLNGHMRVA